MISGRASPEIYPAGPANPRQRPRGAAACRFFEHQPPSLGPVSTGGSEIQPAPAERRLHFSTIAQLDAALPRERLLAFARAQDPTVVDVRNAIPIRDIDGWFAKIAMVVDAQGGVGHAARFSVDRSGRVQMEPAR